VIFGATAVGLFGNLSVMMKPYNQIPVIPHPKMDKKKLFAMGKVP